MGNPLKPIFDLRALWFLLFYASLLFVFKYKDEYPVRKIFLVAFFSLLCVTSIVGTQFFPFMAWDKFPNTYPESETDYELRVITENDRELVYDYRATLGVDGVSGPYLTRQMAEQYSYCKNIRISEYLLERARLYRGEVEERSVKTFTRFPPHGLVNMWTKEELSRHGKFTGVRLYEREIRTSDDGTEARVVTEEKLIEYNISTEYDCSQPLLNRGYP